MNDKELHEKARQERNRYQREWRQRNKERVKATNARYRIQKVYQPFVLKMMRDSDHLWWDESEDSYQRINILIDSLEKRKTDS